MSFITYKTMYTHTLYTNVLICIKYTILLMYVYTIYVSLYVKWERFILSITATTTVARRRQNVSPQCKNIAKWNLCYMSSVCCQWLVYMLSLYLCFLNDDDKCVLNTFVVVGHSLTRALTLSGTVFLSLSLLRPLLWNIFREM